MPGDRSNLIEADVEFVKQLGRFGAPPDGVVSLSGSPSPEHIPYLDLCRPREHQRWLADAVVELERRPIIYVIRGFPQTTKLDALCRVLAQRGQAEHLGVLETGQLHVFPLDPFGRLDRRQTVSEKESDAPLTIPRIALNPDAAGHYTPAKFHDDLLNLLTSTIRSIVNSTRLERQVALSWVGRALFFRFLIDRAIIIKDHLDQICGAPELEDCFREPSWAEETSAWLDKVFNGDLLPLPCGAKKLERSSRKALCHELSKILQRTESSGQLRFGWAMLDFGHIPVGLLSQVYENYSHRFEEGKAVRDSIHYTPRAIAEYVVGEAMYDLANPDRARILDPAAGAGVFLVASFRALVRERWKKTGRRPSRKDIREILNTQIVGFDVNEDAIRLAALSLYLTALELDPAPRPLSELRFDSLRGTVLHDMRDATDKGNPILPLIGSLGPHVPVEHREAYDLVVGNPPWTAWALDDKHQTKTNEKALTLRVDDVERVIRSIVASKLSPESAKQFCMVDKTPDLPFLWRALDWVRPNGRIAMIVHARLLFKDTRPGEDARNLLFRAMRITGILNGSALRQTAVWPGADAQFCVCFAESTLPSPDDAFTFISPYLEEHLNQRGILRIDASDAKVVSHSDVTESPSLLKTLYRGTELDATVIAKLEALGYPTLDEYWAMLGLKSGQGFLSGASSRRWRPEKARHLVGLPKLTRDFSRGQYFISTELLPKVSSEDTKTISRPRLAEIYRGPLVLVPESPPSPNSTVARSVHLALGDVAYNRSFFGFSCHGYPKPKVLAYHLLVLLASDLAIYLALMRSSRFGVERDTLLLKDVRALWVRPLNDLTGAESRAISAFAERMLAGAVPRQETNEFVYHLYALTSVEREIIRDSLRVSAPFTHSKREAQRRPSSKEVEEFVSRLELALHPFFTRRDHSVNVRVIVARPDVPWIFLRISTGAACVEGLSQAETAAVVEEANLHGASMLTVREQGASVLLGLLAQLRYWTPTRARLVAAEIRRVNEDYLVEGK